MKKLIGNRAFYRLVLSLALPLLLQNAISTFVNLLDNLMVGQVGTEPMSGVSIVNQILFVYNMCLFGGMSGAGIYAAQYHGKGDKAGVQNCLRYTMYLGVLTTILGLLLFRFASTPLITAFLHDAGGEGDLEATLLHAENYLAIILWGLAPFAVTNAYTTVLRVTGDTRLPMRASIAALLTNLGLNWVLIFGRLGFPVMGVEGAAVATVISRYVEAGIILLRVHTNPGKYPFADGVYRTLRVPAGALKEMASKSLPILVNELFWSLGQTMLTQCYSVRGLSAVAAVNIYSTASNLFNIVLFTMGNCTAIILGNVLGANELERARGMAPQLMTLSSSCCALCGALLALCAPWISGLYNTSTEIQGMATALMRVHAVLMPLDALCNTSYFTIRSGGRILITVLFDSVYSWVVFIPLASALVYLTALPMVKVAAIVMSTNAIKAVIGCVLVHKGIWVRNIVSDAQSA